MCVCFPHVQEIKKKALYPSVLVTKPRLSDLWLLLWAIHQLHADAQMCGWTQPTHIITTWNEWNNLSFSDKQKPRTLQGNKEDTNRNIKETWIIQKLHFYDAGTKQPIQHAENFIGVWNKGMQGMWRRRGLWRNMVSMGAAAFVEWTDYIWRRSLVIWLKWKVVSLNLWIGQNPKVLCRVSTWGRCGSMHFLSIPLLPLWRHRMQAVHLACIKLSSTEMKCKFSSTASCMTHLNPHPLCPLPFFSPLPSWPLPCQPCVLRFACPHPPPPPPSSSGTEKSNSRGRHTEPQASEQTNLFPKLTQDSFESPSENSNRAT